MNYKVAVGSLNDEEEKNDGGHERKVSESEGERNRERERKTNLFAKPFARLQARRNFISFLFFSSRYILFRGLISRVRLPLFSFPLSRENRDNDPGRTKRDLCVK